MKITIDVDFNAIKKGLRKEREESYRTLKKAVIRDTDPYVPMSNLNHTHLKDTPGLNHDMYSVVYDTDYAGKIYKGSEMNFNKSQHPKATHEWLEASKAVNIKNWIKLVGETYGNKKK